MINFPLGRKYFFFMLLCYVVYAPLFGNIAPTKVLDTPSGTDVTFDIILSDAIKDSTFLIETVSYVPYETTAYCTPTTTNSASQRYIKKMDFIGTLNDTSNSSTYASSSPIGYQNFTSASTVASQAQNEGVNIYAEANSRGRWKAWVDWNKDGQFNESTEIVYNPGSYAALTTTFGFVIPENTTPGDYRLRIRVYNSFTTINGSTIEYFGYNFNACETFDTNTVYYAGQNRNFQEYGEAEDYTFTVLESCDAYITDIIDGETCGNGIVDLAVSGSDDVTEFRWYNALTGGSLVATTVTGDWTTPNISTTTSYYVTAYNGFCESYERTEVIAHVNPIPTLNFSPENPTVCGDDDILTLSATGDFEQIYLIDEDFESGLGVFENINNDGNTSSYDQYSKWQTYTSTIVPEGKVWFPAISSGFGDDHFAMANSDLINSPAPNNINNMLTLTNAVNTSEFVSLNLEFDMFYSRYLPNDNETFQEYFLFQVSTDNGNSWNTVLNYNEDVGIGSRFENISIDLSEFVGFENLKIRFNHYSYSTSSGWLPDGVAVDDVKLYGDKPLNTAFNWISDTTVDAYTNEACTIPYAEGTPVDTVFIKPTLDQLQLPSYTFTASATLTNSCYANTSVTVTNTTRVWQGNSDDWTDINNWLPAEIPTSENCVIIKDVQTASIPENTQGHAKNFKVKNNGEFTIESNAALTVEETIIVEENGTFHIEDNGSLVQVQDVANTGIITMDRNSTIGLFDYVYWSSPVASFAVNDISPNTPSSYIYEWLPTVNNSVGNWVNSSGNMMLGKGYIVRAPSEYSSTETQEYTATFDGTPNNGTITTTISRGNYTGENYENSYGATVTNMDDNFNLVGNPYPSAIDAGAFLSANENIEGTIQIWTHGEAPSESYDDSFYDDFQYNYTQEDYIVFNATGSSAGPDTFDGYIGASQGFFIQMTDGAEITSSVIFDNGMRSGEFNNSQFFRSMQTTETTTPENLEGRFWLDLITPSNDISRTLVGYLEGATNEKDRLYDSYTINNPSLFTLLGTKRMEIQARSIPFDNTDMIPLGFNATSSGNYTIALANVDGIFENLDDYTIYIEDTYSNQVHNLSQSPYTFNVSTADIYNDRFYIKYVETALNSDKFLDENTILVYQSSNRSILNISSSKENLKEITIYTVNGQKLLSLNNLNTSSVQIPLKQLNNVILVNIQTIDNHLATKKIVH
ncbi:hypothetical protein SAMN05216480_101592 [Pustulibacterium marinum]|uniref:Uncharacterized protein n=1 Tax=Pustulibacterium marinum TaxID=1224947 RepID=A0A1I7F3F3_9FLAO|nr:GEVED domain-containing protein [Pustulibacterium marinum]SFU30687.1 hypothetical protein SAMN05216480_101592 [Pustulibacterium marinum]